MHKPSQAKENQRCRKCAYYVGHCVYDGMYGCIEDEAPNELNHKWRQEDE